MTNKTFSLMAAVLLLLAACNNIDSAFVDQIQTGLNKAQENRAAFESGQQNGIAILDKLEKMPAGIKNDPKYSYADLYSQALQIEQKCAHMITNLDEVVAKTESALNEYTDGKIKKEEAEQQASALLNNFDGYQKRVELLNNMVTELDKTCDDLQVKWASATTAEKAASEAMAPPVLPDIAASRNSTGISLPAQIRAAGDAAASGTSQTSPTGRGGASATTPNATAPAPANGALKPATPGSLVAPKPDGGN